MGFPRSAAGGGCAGSWGAPGLGVGWGRVLGSRGVGGTRVGSGGRGGGVNQAPSCPGNEAAFDLRSGGTAHAAARRAIRKAIQIRNEVFEVLMNLIARTFIIPHGFK